ncbi:MAG: NADH-quinone oxidoreductase subunit NuoB [Candidatus Aureabacteria bacterium]|nr:NADH-quinone oxidoreductase subunit NuoB [Candidatus Auribacterota bacterium]
MLTTLLTRIKQKHRTYPFPDKKPLLPERFRGLPDADCSKCDSGCDECVKACPVNALSKKENQELLIDLGRCLFCLDCTEACPRGAIHFSNIYSLSSAHRKDLIWSNTGPFKPKAVLDKKRRKLFQRSLKLRQVSAGGCNACEADINVLNTPFFDLSRFGIQFVASPRHADGILITGPVTQNMHDALIKTYEAVPDPKIVIALGACAISGGLYSDHAEATGIPSSIPVDLYIPGCPPHPFTILDGLLHLLGIKPNEDKRD